MTVRSIIAVLGRTDIKARILMAAAIMVAVIGVVASLRYRSAFENRVSLTRSLRVGTMHPDQVRSAHFKLRNVDSWNGNVKIALEF